MPKNCSYCDVPMAPDSEKKFLVCSKNNAHKIKLPDIDWP